MTIEEARRLVRPGGRIVAVGYSVGSRFELDPTRLVLEEVTLAGSRGFTVDELRSAIKLVEEGNVTMVTRHVMPLENASDEYAALAAGDLTGRAVIVVAGRESNTH